MRSASWAPGPRGSATPRAGPSLVTMPESTGMMPQWYPRVEHRALRHLEGCLMHSCCEPVDDVSSNRRPACVFGDLRQRSATICCRRGWPPQQPGLRGASRPAARISKTRADNRGSSGVARTPPRRSRRRPSRVALARLEDSAGIPKVSSSSVSKPSVGHPVQDRTIPVMRSSWPVPSRAGPPSVSRSPDKKGLATSVPSDAEGCGVGCWPHECRQRSEVHAMPH